MNNNGDIWPFASLINIFVVDFIVTLSFCIVMLESHQLLTLELLLLFLPQVLMSVQDAAF